VKVAAVVIEKTVAPRAPPAWARPEGVRLDSQNIGFYAGATLASLDPIIRSEPAFAGVWRHRLALRAAAATVAMIGRSEREAELRDAWCLRGKADALGPAGGHLEAWRALTRKSTPSLGSLQRIASNFGVAANAPLDEILALVEQTDSVADPLNAAAQTVAAIYARTPAAELLGLWLADFVLARRLRWALPAPLLALHLVDPAIRRAADAATTRPDGEGWRRLVAFAYAKGAATAIDLACELHRRADKLITQTIKLRAKGARAVVAALLAEDAIAPAARIGGMSDRAMRRLADRLVDLGAARELTRRATFRLYGL
jgi:Protein of unknown function (DUF1403)